MFRSRAWGPLPIIIYCGVFFCVASGLAQERASSPKLGVGQHSPYFSSKYQIKNRAQPTFNIHGYVPGAVPLESNIGIAVEIDSIGGFVTIRDVLNEHELYMPMALSFEQFREIVVEQEMRLAWQEYVRRDITAGQDGSRGRGGINLEIPVKIKSKAFQQIFGSGTVGLQVTGDISIKASLRREKRSEVRDALTRGSNTNFNMEQKQRFQVTGKIGDKVTVNVDQDSERAFDFDNNVRLNYQGYEDEIVQRIEAGNISLSLPGTRYVTFSGKNSGLFGIKSEMVLGDLNLTTIASQEKGQSQRLSLSGGASEGTRRVEDHQYVKNTYFFLDRVYRDNYRRYDVNLNHLAIAQDSSVIQSSIEVYKSAPGYDYEFPDRSFAAWAIYDYPWDGNISPDQLTTSNRTGLSEFGNFVRLEKTEYSVEPDLGYIRMNSRVTKEEILAVTFRTNVATFGDTVNNEVVLKLIKPRNPQPSYPPTKFLEWKNVYSIGGQNIELDGLEVKLLFKESSGPDEEIADSGQNWLTVFGLDNKDLNGNLTPDGEIDLDNNTIDRFHGEIHFPDLRPFDPVGYFVGGELVKQVPEDKLTPAIYDTTTDSIINANSNFYLDIKTTNRSTQFDLGFNVIEGSEIVTLNGRELVRGVDYNIDYFSGQLNILNEQASNPAAQLDITYERNQLFQLEKKTILGMRAEYELGRDSFLGGTFLYLNESTLEEKVRVGRGPMRNMVWDLNTRLRFTPNFVGKAFDFLPMVRAKGETQLNFEGEIAQVLPTPNTLNNPSTGDNNGVAYVDDFEGAKRTTSLGVLRKGWTQASVPAGADSLWNYSNLASLLWFNPFNQVHINDIYPEREVNTQVSQRTHVLTLEVFPEDESDNQTNRWAGVMRALSSGFFDQSETRFIEVMVQGDQGRLHVDLGLISEDVIRNNRLDTEDSIVRNNLLDDGEDTGIDGYSKPDPPTRNFPIDNFVGQTIEEVPYDFWDVNQNGIKDADEPWSFDDWDYSESNPFQYFDENINGSSTSINGVEGNANDQGGRVPDTEDINQNGIVDQVDLYFSYSFSLENDHPDTSLIVGGNPDNPPQRGGPWKLYRIPFTSETAALFGGNPSATQIEYVRIWIDQIDQYSNQPVVFSIADISLVGNEWKDLGITSNENDTRTGLADDENFNVAVINTHDNPEYIPPEGVEGELDRVTNVRAKEQALVLKTTELDTGMTGIAQKSFFQSENYIHYDRIKMFVYGLDEGSGNHIPTDGIRESKVEYFLRFGSDPDNYYEYRSRVYAGWDERNHMNVALQDFTQLTRPDSTERSEQFIDSTKTKSIAVVGNPSITNVRVLILGLKNVEREIGDPFVGEVRFNELRLSGVERDKGIAMRVRGDMRIADFATINAEVERKDADFHNVSTRFGTGDNSLSGNFNASVNVDKMLPQALGVSMPLTLNYRQSSSTPKYFTGRDRLVTDDISEAELATVRTRSRQRGFNLAIRRTAQSDNFFVKHLFDNVRNLSVGYSENKLESPTLAISNSRTWTGSLDYQLNFGRNNYISLFSWVPDLPLLNKMKGTRFYYTPQNLAFRMGGTKTDTEKQNRAANAQLNTTEVFDFDRSVRTSMKVFENLTLDYSRAHKADMKNADASDFLKFNFNDYNISQNFTGRYNPEIFSWLSNNFNYSANYTFNENLQQQSFGKNARVSTTKSADFVFRWKELASSVFGFGDDPRGRGRRGRPSPSRPRPGERQPGEEEQQEEEEDGESFNPLALVGEFFSKFKDISFDYSERKNITQNALLEGLPDLGFQFGLTDESGVPSDSNYASVPRTLGTNKSYNVSSGLDLGRAVDVALRFDHTEQRNDSQSGVTGSTTNSWVRFRDFDLPFPEWTVRISGLEDLPLFNKLFKSVTFSHNFSGSKNEGWNETPDNLTRESFTTNFRPLGKLDLSFKNGFSGNIQLNRSRTFDRTFTGGSVGLSRKTNEDLSITANYSKRSGFRIPIWPFNKAELKNSIDFTFTFSASKVLSEKTSVASGDVDESDLEEFDRTTRWLFSPRLTYSFSNQVRGGAFIEFGKTVSKLSGATSFQEFGIDINISIRGR